MLDSQLSQQINCRVFEKGLGNLAFRFGPSEGRRVSAGKKARYVGGKEHTAR